MSKKLKIGNAITKRTPEQLERDRMFCADLYTRGYTFREIGYKLNLDLEARGMGYSVTFQMVWGDIKKILIEWKRDRKETIDQFMLLEIKKLDKMEVELWDAWEQSKSGKRKTKIKGGTVERGNVTGGTLDNRTTETTSGNPRYMDLLLTLADRRAKLLGWDAPIRVNLTGNVDTVTRYDTDSIPDELLFKMANAIQDANSKKKVEEPINA